jgi:hypothetical protein
LDKNNTVLKFCVECSNARNFMTKTLPFLKYFDKNATTGLKFHDKNTIKNKFCIKIKYLFNIKSSMIAANSSRTQYLKNNMKGPSAIFLQIKFYILKQQEKACKFFYNTKFYISEKPNPIKYRISPLPYSTR